MINTQLLISGIIFGLSLGGIFFLIALIFIYRSFYGMRIGEEKL